LDEHITVVSEDGRRARAISTEFGHDSIFTDDFFYFHFFVVLSFLVLVNQNCGFWFIRGKGGGHV
jgi:hypothetical protein